VFVANGVFVAGEPACTPPPTAKLCETATNAKVKNTISPSRAPNFQCFMTFLPFRQSGMEFFSARGRIFFVANTISRKREKIKCYRFMVG
jgi:hypothetical protein